MYAKWHKYYLIFIAIFLIARISLAGNAQYLSPILFEQIEETSLHPAGPTIRREWRNKNTSELFRLEVTRLRSGQLIFDDIALMHHPKLGWYLVDKSHNTVLKITSRDIEERTPLLFYVNGQRWNLIILREEFPIGRSGISTEAEYALDIESIRLEK